MEEEDEKAQQAGAVAAQQAEAANETQETDSISDMQAHMLLSETVQARFPLQEVDEEGSRREDDK